MATIVEREIHHSHDAGGTDNSSVALVVAIVALVIIAGFALFFFRLFPFNGAATGTGNGGSINIDADIPTGTPTPDSTQY
jgi:hypothetical protein